MYSSLSKRKSSSKAQKIQVTDVRPSIFDNTSTNASNRITKRYKRSNRKQMLQLLGKKPTDGIQYAQGESDLPVGDSNTSNSTMNFIPSDDENENKKNGSDDELIDMDFETHEPLESHDFKSLDKLISTSKRTTKSGSKVEYKLDLQGQNVLENVINGSNLTVIKDAYKDKPVPKVPKKRSQILARVKPHLKIIPGLLSGKTKMSYFYDLAKQVKHEHDKDSLTQRDKQTIDWSKFVGGYYGLNRQMFIGDIIRANFKTELQKSYNGNSTLSFWGADDFANYVLSNEIIIRLIMDDYKCDFAKAEQLIGETSDYGSVTDSIDIVTDINLTELRII